MTDMIFARDIRPPRQFDHDRLAEEHRTRVAEYNAVMATWHAAEPVVASELGMPRRLRWEPRELPAVPDAAAARGIPEPQPCPECDAERQSHVAIADYDHTHFRREYDMRKQWAPVAEVKQVTDPHSGQSITTLTKPGLP